MCLKSNVDSIFISVIPLEFFVIISENSERL